MAQFLQVTGQHAVFTNVFNIQHASELLSTIKVPIRSLEMRNVGIKVMRMIFDCLGEEPITKISIDYDWNAIMTNPQLVCWDKLPWKTLQQLKNWSLEWSQLFKSCQQLVELHVALRCSWMNCWFTRDFLMGILRMRSIYDVKLELASKDAEVEETLQKFQELKLFKDKKYQYSFLLQK